MSKNCVTYSININGKLMDLSSPCVMGIINVTPDSFYTSIAPNEVSPEEKIISQAEKMISLGAKILDVGGCSTRPGGEQVSPEEEWTRLEMALKVICEKVPDCCVSVDTYRADIAERCIEEYGIGIVNDVSGGSDEMFDVVAKYKLPYILTFNEPRKTSQTITQQALMFFAEHAQKLRDRGVKDIILDPGFGFNKTLDENYELLRELEMLKILELPLLVGVSRKSMIYRLLDETPNEALNGTSVLNTISLQKGANILRVHDVKEAMECIRICEKL